MKKKLIVCTLLVVIMLLMASTVFAYSFQNPYAAWTSSSLYFSTTMRGVNQCTNSTMNSSSGTFVSYTCYLVEGNTKQSGLITVTAPNSTKYLYPNTAGSLSLRIVNPYPSGTHYASGSFSNQYY